MTKWHDDDHLDRGINSIFDSLLARFHILDKKGDDADNDDIVKLSGSIGYLSQVKIGMEKSIAIRKEINDIKVFLKRVPPEVLASLNQLEELEVNASLR